MKMKIKLTGQMKSVLIIYGLLGAVFCAMLIVSPSYRSIGNIGNIIIQTVPLAVVSLGQTIVMISGGIDMSVGSLISLSTCIAATIMKGDSPELVLPSLLAVFAVAIIVGAINGIGVNYLNVPPMITTLSMMIFLSGIAQAVLPIAGGKVYRPFAEIVMARWGLISVPLLILVITYIILRHFLYNTRGGVATYAIGNNRSICSSMGVSCNKVSIRAYIIAALCAAITGLLLASRMRIGDPITGTSFSLDSITAAAIGGTALSGGVGLLSGTVAGAFLIGMLSNMMNILGVNHFYQYVLKGLLLVLAMIIYTLYGKLGGKRNGK